MSKRTRWWLTGIAGFSVIAAGVILYLASRVTGQIEPYIRAQAEQYLERRFNADVRIGSFQVELPAMSKLKMWRTKGNNAIARVAVDNVVLQRKGRPDEPAILSLRHVAFELDVAAVLDRRKEVRHIHIDGMELHVPPKGDRKFTGGESPDKPSDGKPGGSALDILISEITVANTGLYLHSRDPKKKPLDFQIQNLRMLSDGFDKPLRYEAVLQNPRPPGKIDSTGTFGPWNTDDPGSSPLQGVYKFTNADLSVFKAIAGTLQSEGKFSGELSHVMASGEAYVPNFQLKMSGNPIPLRTSFDVEVDGTNGNTILKPVRAVLGKSRFSTSGSVIKHEDDPRRTIALDVKMPSGQVEDFLRLAIKGTDPIMEGKLNLNANIVIPPLTGKVVEKLRLKGTFVMTQAKFLRSQIQDKIDALSRKGQGEPKNEGIDEVVSKMSGAFVMEDQTIEFSRLAFDVPGADIDLAGMYDLDAELLNFRGTMKLTARVSETQSGWKRWALKPVDPFFAKNGAGTFLRIKITGPRSSPSFGLDRSSTDKKDDVAGR